MRHPICLFILSCSLSSFAQTEGNNVFGTDQILQVDVTFYSDGFWNELLTEYDGEQNYIPAGISITSLDGVAQFDSVGIRLKGKPVFSVQYHPEASPGPRDSHYLFKRFTDFMRIGIPLNLSMSVLVSAVIPLIW